MGTLAGINAILSPLSPKQERRPDGQLNRGVSGVRYEKAWERVG